mmetsp:Transcript_43916/g.79411  ORF Transcript_43916/g.79411 Transcript_43916/m.79411 type:complete len:256 (+) Transcript_43916:62-829(+)
MISISTYLAPALLLQSLLIFAPLSVQVLARLGQPNETNATEATEAQPLDASFNSTSGAGAEELQLISETGLMNFTLGSSALGGYGGYSQFATSTSYGDSSKAACGGLHTGELVSGTRYYNVASAQSMWKGCATHGNCWCGASGGGSGTLGMGCFSCAKGRFLRSAYGSHGGRLLSEGQYFASHEIIVVVGDLCPYAGNEHWCPEKAGQTNHYGAHNHLDFSHPPGGIDNNNFVFTPIECPGDLRWRFHKLSSCGR